MSRRAGTIGILTVLWAAALVAPASARTPTQPICNHKEVARENVCLHDHHFPSCTTLVELPRHLVGFEFYPRGVENQFSSGCDRDHDDSDCGVEVIALHRLYLAYECVDRRTGD